ncbi:MAG: hypothetical protein ACAH11_15245 [Sphingomonas sp.]
MKLFPLIAAAGLAFIAPTAASASVVPAEAPIAASSAPYAQTSVRISVGDQRRHHYRRHDRRRSYWRRNCRSYWRHGHRVRDCRRVRYWR